MMLEALIFDVDGTLADTEEAHRRAFNAAFEQADLDWHWSKPLYAELLRTTGGKERIAAYVATLPLGDTARRAALDMIPDLHRVKTAIYTRMVGAGEAPLRDGVERLLDEAAAAGVALAIATTTSFDNIRALLETNLGEGALSRFRAIGAGDDVARKKPAPDIYLHVLDKLRVKAPNCAAFEDSANGLAAAKARRPVHHRDAELLDRGGGFFRGGPRAAAPRLDGLTAAAACGAWSIGGRDARHRRASNRPLACIRNK